MASPEQQMDSLRENLSRVILDQLAETLRDYPSGSLSNPVLRFEAFIQDGETETQGRSPRSPVVSVSCNSSDLAGCRAALLRLLRARENTFPAVD